MEDLDSTTARPFRGSTAIRDGRISKGRLRGPSFVPLYTDTYVGADAELTLGVRRRAVAVWGGPGAVVAGSLAADAYRVDLADEVAEVIVPSRRRSPAGLVVHEDRLPPHEVAEVDGVRVTSPVRTALDLARRLPLADGVAMADALGRRCRFGPDALRVMINAHAGVAHLRRARLVVPYVDPLAESLPESRIRVALVVRGVPRPVLQRRVPTSTGVYRLDLSWPGAMLAVEYDGEEHRSIGRHGDDLDRDASLLDLGWLVLRVTDKQLRDPDALAARVLRHLAARSPRGAQQC